MKRRTFLFGTAGALVVGWSLLPPRQRLTTAQPLATRDAQAVLNGWVKIAADNTVTVVMCKSEMGQGVYTGAAMLLAEELDADGAQVRIEQSPIDKIYNNLASVVDGLPFHPDDDGSIKRVAGWLVAKTMREIGVMMTCGSSSIKDLWLPMREAGASVCPGRVRTRPPPKARSTKPTNGRMRASATQSSIFRCRWASTRRPQKGAPERCRPARTPRRRPVPGSSVRLRVDLNQLHGAPTRHN